MSISVTLIRTLLDYIGHRGLDTQRYLQQSGFDASLLDNPNNRIELAEYDRLQELAIEFTGDEAMGLHMGDIVSPSAFNVVGHLFMSCATVREALDSFFKYHRIISDCDPSTLEENGEWAHITYDYPRSNARLNRVRSEFGPTQIVKLSRAFFSSTDLPFALEFEHPQPDYVDEYHRLLGGSIAFNKAATRIIFPAKMLDKKQPHANPPLYELLKDQADRLLTTLNEKDTLAQQIMQLVIEEFQGVKPDMDTVAQRFNISSRSLRRRLKESGYTYGKIIDMAQCDVAKQLFGNHGMTIQEVAYHLGFSDVSSFHRAFKRWTGKTPQQYRDMTRGAN